MLFRSDNIIFAKTIFNQFFFILFSASGTNSAEVKVKLNDSATLPCDGRCSGLVRWSQNSSVVVAQCNQTSCLSVKEGFNMSHDLYLKGNNSLIIPVADPSKSGEYMCRCDHKYVNNVVLVVCKCSSVFFLISELS